MLFTASTNTGNFTLLSYSKTVYVHLDWFVYEDIDILRMLKIWTGNMFYHSVHMPILSTNNLKSLVTCNSCVSKLGHTEERAVATRDCALLCRYS